MPIKIALADDHTIVRNGLRALLEKEADFEVVCEVADGRAAVRCIGESAPDLMLMDVAMPELNGIEATRQLRRDHPEVRVIALSMHSDRRYVVEMLKAGAQGYLLKDCAQDELARAVRAVAGGQSYLSPAISDVVVSDYLQLVEGGVATPASKLTAREREVLQLVAEGSSTRVIAERLGVSVKTIETHRQQVMRKLDLHSVAELTKYAVREGLTSVDA